MCQSDLLRQADRVRYYVCRMCLAARSGHVTSSLSAVDIVSALYFSQMEFAPPHSDPLDSDSFVLSKGHAAPAVYAALFVNGALPCRALDTFRQIDSVLQGHPDVKRLSAVTATTGALGQGLSMAIGRALAMQHRHKRSSSYCLIGDGESQEGQIWEAALFATNHRVHNIISFTDHNKGQSDGPLQDTTDLAAKWRAFGWFTQEVDGHDLHEILAAVRRAKSEAGTRPSMIIAHTRKGFISRRLSVLGGSHSAEMTEDLLSKIERELGLDREGAQDATVDT